MIGCCTMIPCLSTCTYIVNVALIVVMEEERNRGIHVKFLTGRRVVSRFRIHGGLVGYRILQGQL